MSNSIEAFPQPSADLLRPVRPDDLRETSSIVEQAVNQAELNGESEETSMSRTFAAIQAAMPHLTDIEISRCTWRVGVMDEVLESPKVQRWIYHYKDGSRGLHGSLLRLLARTHLKEDGRFPISQIVLSLEADAPNTGWTKTGRKPRGSEGLPEQYRQAADPDGFVTAFDFVNDVLSGRKRIEGVENPRMMRVIAALPDVLADLSVAQQQNIIFRISRVHDVFDAPQLARWVQQRGDGMRIQESLIHALAAARLMPDGDFPINDIATALAERDPDPDWQEAD